jgi:transposase-like protein
MLEHGVGARQAAEFAGFGPHNADPVIRPRGVTTDEIVFAAIAMLFSTGRTRKDIAGEVNFSESQVKSWLQRARERGLLSRPGRELSSSARRLLAADGRDPVEIVRTWSQIPRIR